MLDTFPTKNSRFFSDRNVGNTIRIYLPGGLGLLGVVGPATHCVDAYITYGLAIYI